MYLTERASHLPYIENPLVQLISTLETHDMIILELELMGGGDLFDVLEKSGALTEEKVKVFMKQLVNGIAFCQEHRVAHRDIKLSNLALTKSTPYQYVT